MYCFCFFVYVFETDRSPIAYVTIVAVYAVGSFFSIFSSGATARGSAGSGDAPVSIIAAPVEHDDLVTDERPDHDLVGPSNGQVSAVSAISATASVSAVSAIAAMAVDRAGIASAARSAIAAVATIAPGEDDGKPACGSNLINIKKKIDPRATVEAAQAISSGETRLAGPTLGYAVCFRRLARLAVDTLAVDHAMIAEYGNAHANVVFAFEAIEHNTGRIHHDQGIGYNNIRRTEGIYFSGFQYELADTYLAKRNKRRQIQQYRKREGSSHSTKLTANSSLRNAK